jgi:Stress responsive A/B Barrel Domain
MTKEPAGLRHIVVFKYKPDASVGAIQQITDAFRALQHKIPGIRSFEQGLNNSPERLDQGFTHVYQLTFENSAARDAYLPHPEHAQFGALLAQLAVLDGVFVVDYVPEP